MPEPTRRPNPKLKQPKNPTQAKRRAQLVKRARNGRAEILQLFTDVDYWNQHVRKPNEEPIDIDADGALKRTLAYYNELLAPEDGEAEGVH